MDDDFMWMRDLPGFWETLVHQLDIIGVSNVVGSLISLAAWLKGVLDAAKMSAHLAGRSYDVASGVIRNPPSTPFLAGLITMLVLIAQAGTIGLCYIAGNYLELAFAEQNKLARLFELLEAGRWEIVTDGSFWNFFRWSPYSSAYVVLGIALMLFTHSKAWRSENSFDERMWGFILALPASITCVCLFYSGILILAACAGLFILMILATPDLLNDFLHTLSTFIPVAALGIVCLAFWGACYAAVRGSLVIATAWKPAVVPTP